MNRANGPILPGQSICPAYCTTSPSQATVFRVRQHQPLYPHAQHLHASLSTSSLPVGHPPPLTIRFTTKPPNGGSTSPDRQADLHAFQTSDHETS
ncbi:hypothetical protein BO78DRAFT_393234 [Aspergillus sclerotiicarbonarius CBS 121057]|uniref:Uncharacterized protein n=1 Tax=Aspergillus sclerotiicarbonarius (strain CBS 121057 / IBT 28362) TaxID=1448318 RepID=A0A319EUE6_ASPSB|nr:hypothetical protein BO78DRAFT_393234 [Aspergillus sclerotiicarbonarius CBS 121057]